MHLRDRLSIPDDALVLEVGGGGDPHPRASVLVDKFPDADGVGQRGGVELVVDSRVLIQADGSRLPFRDHQFDYVIASHVIEHVPLPDVLPFVCELQRVARRGYLEAPSIVYESMRRIPEHLWFVHLAAGVVHLAPRGSPEAWTTMSEPLFDDAAFGAVMERLADVFFVGMEWEETLFVEMHDTVEQLVALVPDGWAREATLMGNSRARARELERSRTRRLVAAALPPFLKQRLGAVVHRSRKDGRAAGELARGAESIIGWRELVVCPVCHGALVEEMSGTLRCAICRRRYEVSCKDVPCLLAE